MSTRQSWCQSIGRGIREDLARRLPHYHSDWIDVCNWKVLSSTIFMFLSSFGPAITFSLLLSDNTDQQIGVMEVLLSTAVTGCLMAIFSGQPLVIVGVTGPVSILTTSIYSLAKSFHIDFLSFYAWSQIWASLMIMLLAIFNACDTVRYITNFSCETFGVLIGLIYLYTGLDGIAKILSDHSISFANALIQLIVALGAFFTSSRLHHAKEWPLFTNRIKNLLTDYGPPFSILFWSGVPYLCRDRFSNHSTDGSNTIPTLEIPLSFATTAGRSWLIDLGDIPVWVIFAAIFPGFIITVLFYFDHNVSSVMTQTKEMKLQKGSAYHWDFFVLGVGVLMTGILGLPPTNGLIPQAPLHAKSLLQVTYHRQPKPKKTTTREEEQKESTTTTPTSVVDRSHLTHRTNSQKEKVEEVAAQLEEEEEEMEDIEVLDSYEIIQQETSTEQRLSNFLQSVLCGLAAVPPFSTAVKQIPTCVLYGLFLFLGIASLEGNDLYERIIYFTVLDKPHRHEFFTEKYQDYPATPDHHKEDGKRFRRVIRSFTIIQSICCGIIFGITFTPAEVIFPVLIALLMLIRLYLLPKLFERADLEALDEFVVQAATMKVDQTTATTPTTTPRHHLIGGGRRDNNNISNQEPVELLELQDLEAANTIGCIADEEGEVENHERKKGLQRGSGISLESIRLNAVDTDQDHPHHPQRNDGQ